MTGCLMNAKLLPPIRQFRAYLRGFFLLVDVIARLSSRNAGRKGSLFLIRGDSRGLVFVEISND